MVEREARCLALEQAYVHEVYHQMGGGDHRQHPPWPRVTQFLNQLEPGSIVCDVGCGNGKYLNVNPSVFKVGVDRCSTLTETAKEEQNEVLVCDNLSLPFRDESFDAVLSIAVIHHFATTERRVGAIKELARVLRIGGRLVITAWAMEQRHRKFESQDVLVPWHRPQTLSTPSLELTPTTTTSEEDSHHHLYAACIHTSDSDSCHSARMNNGRRRSKGKLKEVVPSSSSSSLSSPNESCYSFVRRALKKLAGVKRSGTRHRPWFLESWSACSWKEPPPRRYDPEGCEDIQDLPIELRRLDDDQDLPLKLFPLPQQSFSKSDHNVDSSIAQKSKSLTDIMATDHKSIVRSQSSVPSLELHDSNGWNGNSLPVQKPRLVKQKQSMCCDEDVESEERDKATEMSDLIKSLPEFKVSGFGLSKRGNVFKQSSMNEELLSAERLREKERVRQNIQKQASLNEELIYNRNNKTFDSLRDTLFSTSTAKRFKLIKNGLTNKIKSSTTGIEKVSGASIKNGFVRILQGWTSSDLGMPSTQATSSATASPQNIAELKSTHSCDGKKEVHERRHSREDGSDSSKDSSLQSDTSVDSEDSFASVIFVPKSDQLEEQSTNTSPTLQSTPASPQPTSPKIKFPPPISPKMKSSSQISFALASYPSSPKMKHPGQLMSSTTPTSPKIKYFPQPTSPRPFQTAFLASSNRSSFKAQQSPNGTSSYPNQICKAQLVATKSLPTHCIPLLVPTRPPAASDSRDSTLTPSSLTSGGPSSDGSADLEQFDFSPAPPSVVPRDAGDESVDYTDFKPSTTPGVSPTAVMRPDEVSEAGSGSDVGVVPAQLPVKTKPQIEDNSAVKKRNVMRTQFPLVRSMYSSTDTPPSRSVPRLLLLEIFNPETDDMDSDSSGLSSPDSVGSVISIKAEEEKPAESLGTENQSNTMVVVDRTSGVGAELRSFRGDNAEECSRLMLELKEPYGACNALSTRLSPLLEAAVDVATSLEETVDAVIQSSPQAKRRQVLQKSDPRLVKLQADLLTPNYKGEPSSSDESLKDRKHIQLDLNKSVDTKTKMASYSNDLDDNPDKRWDEECRQHLADFAEKLSEKLLAEIDRYREQSTAAKPLSPVLCGESQVMDQSQDPYLCKLSEDLQDLTKLSIELQDVPKLQPELTFNEVVDDSTAVKRIKGEGAAVEEPLVENCKKKPDHSEDLSTYFLMEDQIPLLHEYAEEIHTRNLISTFTESGSFDTSAEKKKKTEVNAKEEQQCSDKESSAELSDPESTESDGNWADSRRNTILPNSKALLVKPQVLPSFPALTYKEGTKIELLPAKDMPRRPSISVEMTEPIMDFIQREKDEVMFDGGQLHLGVSVESSEAGDISERTGSSSEGSRPSSRRETIQISDSGSVLSLRPGLSVESSEAGDYSDRAGSDGSRESRRDNASMGDITSGSQCSLLRPGNSVESSDTGDVSERTSSDVSRQNTSSAGKTPSTASFTSDKASDCSKDARFADRRMARCDGRSSSEEMPVPRTSMNKLVRQRASTQEPSELLVKAQSYETSISGSTSQDSLLSDSGGGAITFHRYYHVFREGELDQLIERYVENLHIISSYYDHANWCVVAEKVQVWTI